MSCFWQSPPSVNTTALSQHTLCSVTAAPGCSAWADKALLIKKEGSTRCAGSSVPQVSQSVGAGLIKLNKLHFQHHICTIVLFCFYIKKKILKTAELLYPNFLHRCFQHPPLFKLIPPSQLAMPWLPLILAYSLFLVGWDMSKAAMWHLVLFVGRFHRSRNLGCGVTGLGIHEHNW